MTPDRNTDIRSLEQGRAKFAYDCAVIGSGITKKSEYRAYVKKIPMLIKTNGLGATFAFIKSKSISDESKSGYAYHLIYEHTTEWLRNDPKNLLELNENQDLAEKIVSLDSPQYRAATNEVLAFFTWLRRFAEGLIESEDTNGAEDAGKN